MKINPIYHYNVTLTVEVRSALRPNADRVTFARELLEALANLTPLELSRTLEEIIVTGVPVTRVPRIADSESASGSL